MTDPLEQALGAALDGERADLERFFNVLLGTELVVPKRFQQLPLSDSPKYPNAFLDILGIKDRDRVVVPVFSRAELVHEWTGTEFAVREMTLAELLQILPGDWWITVNPGSEVEKELSPWELSQLKAGEEAIPMLVEESSAFEPDRGMAFVAPPQEFTRVEAELSAYAASKPAIEALYLLQREKIETDSVPALVVGVRAAHVPSSEVDRLRAELLALAERAVIGAATMQVIMGGSVGSSMLDGVFSAFTPFYVLKGSGVLERVKTLLGRKKP